MQNNILNVLFASNNEFSPYLGVSLYSLLENNCKDFKNINVFIFDDGISEDNKKKLSEIAKSYNQNLEFISVVNIESFVGNQIHYMEREGVFSLTTYARLFAASTLSDLDKVLYLDADSLVLGSFKELWEENMGDYYVFGVEDTLGIDIIKKDIGLKETNRYINAGMLLINLKKWREIDLETKFMNFLIKHIDKFIFHDQGIINGVCRDNIYYISPKYNLLGQFQGISYNKAIKWAGYPNYYDEKIVKDAQNNPIFIHFTGNFNRPWSNKYQTFHKIYYDYVNKTPFKKEVKFKSISLKYVLFYRIYKSKFISFILSLVPMSLAVKIARKRVANFVKSNWNNK